MIRFWLLACSLLAGASVLPGASNSFLIAGLRVTQERWNKEANFQKIEHGAREAAAPTLAAPKELSTRGLHFKSRISAPPGSAGCCRCGWP